MPNKRMLTRSKSTSKESSSDIDPPAEKRLATGNPSEPNDITDIFPGDNSSDEEPTMSNNPPMDTQGPSRKSLALHSFNIQRNEPGFSNEELNSLDRVLMALDQEIEPAIEEHDLALALFVQDVEYQGLNINQIRRTILRAAMSKDRVNPNRYLLSACTLYLVRGNNLHRMKDTVKPGVEQVISDVEQTLGLTSRADGNPNAITPGRVAISFPEISFRCSTKYRIQGPVKDLPDGYPFGT